MTLDVKRRFNGVSSHLREGLGSCELAAKGSCVQLRGERAPLKLNSFQAKLSLTFCSEYQGKKYLRLIRFAI